MQGRTCRIVEKIASVDKAHRDEQNALVLNANAAGFRGEICIVFDNFTLFAEYDGVETIKLLA